MSQKVDEQQPGRSTFSKWAIGVGTSVLVAFLVALVTGLANNLVDDRDAVTAVQGSRPQSTPDSGETPPSPVDEPVEPLIDSYLRVIGGGVILDDPFAVEWPAGSDDPADYDRAAIDQVGAVPAKFKCWK